MPMVGLDLFTFLVCGLLKVHDLIEDHLSLRLSAISSRLSALGES
jgi:hypothetical protein